MTCFHPWKPPIHLGLAPTLKLPCNQCTGCRLRRSAEWATRCLHESKQHHYNSWITLTYDDEHLPGKYNTGIIHPYTGQTIYSGTLRKTHMQKFYRRTRKTLTNKTEGQILHSHKPAVDYLPPKGYTGQEQRLFGLPSKPILRYYYGGEYGEKYNRPHYHACLFGIDFRDKKHVETTTGGFKLYESPTLSQLWTQGRHTIAELTWETAAYTARYIMKKITGNNKKQHYEKIDKETGEIITLEPEFNDMSRKPGIGHDWLQQWYKDVYKKEQSGVRIRGNLTQPPRYYDKLYKNIHERHYEYIKLQRDLDARENWKNTTPARLQAEEIITNRKILTLRQKL